MDPTAATLLVLVLGAILCGLGFYWATIRRP
jgi:hypothetical protein